MAKNGENGSVLITGGTPGLGRACVETFLKSGWSVATFGRRMDLISELREIYFGSSLIAEVCDLRVSNHVDNVLDRVKMKFQRLDVIILNAGELGRTPLATVEQLELNDFRTVFETNFFGNISIVQKIMRLFPGGKEVFVHITSDAGSNPYPKWGPYGSSKAAMDFLFKILQSENINNQRRFLSFDPGDMNTEMHRKALPEDKPETLKDPMKSAAELESLLKEMI